MDTYLLATGLRVAIVAIVFLLLVVAAALVARRERRRARPAAPTAKAEPSCEQCGARAVAPGVRGVPAHIDDLKHAA
jgi:hypothetical protein